MIYFILLACACLSSCASLVNGSKQTIPVATEPPGATVTAEDTSQSTPSSLTLERGREYVLTITKEGYKTEKVKVQHVLNSAEAGNIVGFGMLGVAVDSATGACWTLKPENIKVTLRPLSAGERLANALHLNSTTLQNQLDSLKQLRDDNLLTQNEYEVFCNITKQCVQ